MASNCKVCGRFQSADKPHKHLVIAAVDPGRQEALDRISTDARRLGYPDSAEPEKFPLADGGMLYRLGNVEVEHDADGDVVVLVNGEKPQAFMLDQKANPQVKPRFRRWRKRR